MPSIADWTRADIIAALALLVSVFAFGASAVSALVSWRAFVAASYDRLPRLRCYLEPFVDSDVWWIVHFEIQNRSQHAVTLEQLRVLRPLGAKFSKFVEGYSGVSGDGGRMEYNLPDEVKTTDSARSLAFSELEDITLDELPPSPSSENLATVLLYVPKWSVWSTIKFLVKLRELGSSPRICSFKIAAQYPTKENTKARY